MEKEKSKILVILQAKALCAKPCKNENRQDKSLRGTDGAGQYMQQFCDHSVASVFLEEF